MIIPEEFLERARTSWKVPPLSAVLLTETRCINIYNDIVLIQSYIRRHQKKKEFKRISQSAILIQSYIRRYQKKKEFKRISQFMSSIYDLQQNRYSKYSSRDSEFNRAILSKIYYYVSILIKDYRLNLNPILKELNTYFLNDIILIQSFIRGFIQRTRFRKQYIQHILDNIQNIEEDSDDESLEELIRQYNEACEREQEQEILQRQRSENNIISSYRRRTINSSSGVLWDNSINMTNNERQHGTTITPDTTTIYEAVTNPISNINPHQNDVSSIPTEIITNPSCNITGNIIDVDGHVEAGSININNQITENTIIRGGVSASHNSAEASVGVQHEFSENINVTATTSTNGTSSVGVSAPVSENISTTAGVSRGPSGSTTIRVDLKVPCTIM